jgi:L-fuconolactonase
VTGWVDAHHHLWDPSRRRYPFLDSLDPIRRPFAPADFGDAAGCCDVNQSVVVQAVGSIEETRELLAVASLGPIVTGVVGWVDLTAPGVAGVLASLSGGRLVGVRHQVHDEPDPEWLLWDDVQRGLAAVADARLVYDLLVRTRELPAATRAVARLPKLQFVLDHCAKPEIATRGWDPWATAIADLAGYPNVACKLSGLITEASWDSWTVDDLTPYVRHVRDCFGPDRILFGSDWPVCLLAGSYDRVVEALLSAWGPMEDDVRTKVFGGNARRIYRLPSLR